MGFDGATDLQGVAVAVFGVFGGFDGRVVADGRGHNAPVAFARDPLGVGSLATGHHDEVGAAVGARLKMYTTRTIHPPIDNGWDIIRLFQLVEQRAIKCAKEECHMVLVAMETDGSF